MISAYYCIRWLTQYENNAILSDEGHKVIYHNGAFKILYPHINMSESRKWRVLDSMDILSVYAWVRCELTKEEEGKLYVN